MSKKPVKVYNTPVRQCPKKQEVYQEPQQIQQPPLMDYLVNQNYAEQLAKTLKHNMYKRIKQDTFM